METTTADQEQQADDDDNFIVVEDHYHHRTSTISTTTTPQKETTNYDTDDRRGIIRGAGFAEDDDNKNFNNYHQHHHHYYDKYEKFIYRSATTSSRKHHQHRHHAVARGTGINVVVSHQTSSSEKGSLPPGSSSKRLLTIRLLLLFTIIMYIVVDTFLNRLIFVSQHHHNTNIIEINIDYIMDSPRIRDNNKDNNNKVSNTMTTTNNNGGGNITTTTTTTVLLTTASSSRNNNAAVSTSTTKTTSSTAAVTSTTTPDLTKYSIAVNSSSSASSSLQQSPSSSVNLKNNNNINNNTQNNNNGPQPPIIPPQPPPSLSESSTNKSPPPPPPPSSQSPPPLPLPPPSTPTQTSISSSGVVLMGIFCRAKDTKRCHEYFRFIFQSYNNNNNDDDDVDEKRNSDNNNSNTTTTTTATTTNGVVCSLGQYYSQKDQNTIYNCKLVYTFVMFDDENPKTSSLQATKKLNNNNNDRINTNNGDNEEDDIVILNYSREEQQQGGKNEEKMTKSQTWYQYATTTTKVAANIDYVGILNVPQPQKRYNKNNNNVNGANKTRSTAETIVLHIDLDKYFHFANEYLPPYPYNIRRIVGVFTDYDWCTWPKGVNRGKLYREKHVIPYHDSIHLYVHKQLYILSKDLSYDIGFNESSKRITELSNYWKHRDATPCSHVRDNYELSSYALQYVDERPLNVVPINVNTKFWNDGIATNTSSPPLPPPRNHNKNFHGGNGLPQEQTVTVPPSTKKKSVLFMGILCQLQDGPFREKFRSLFNTHPKVCSLGTYEMIMKTMTTTATTASSSPSCEFVYAFVIGANTTNATNIPTEIVSGSLNQIVVDKSTILLDGNETQHNDDFIFLNIRENMEEGKSTTWLYVASQLATIYDIDYVGKMDTDTMIYLDQYFDFANEFLPPAPCNRRRLASLFADKAWWRADGNLVVNASKEVYFKQQYPGSPNSMKNVNITGIHLYGQGQMYILSTDLAMGVAEVARISDKNSLEGGGGGGGGDDRNSYTTSNYYRRHLEGIEDHAISTMAYLWSDENPLNFVVIKKKNQFWRHAGPLKLLNSPQWNKVWTDEISRMDNYTQNHMAQFRLVPKR